MVVALRFRAANSALPHANPITRQGGTVNVTFSVLAAQPDAMAVVAVATAAAEQPDAAGATG